MRIGELFYQLGFQADTTKLNEFLKMVGDLNMSSVLAGVGVAGLYEMTRRFLESTRDSAMEMRTFENVTGMSATQMKAWSNAADQAGVKAGALENAVKNIQSSVMNTKMGNVDMGLMQAYNLLDQYGKAGIDINDSPLTQIEKMRKGLQALTPEAQRAVLSMMHMDESMMNLFKASNEVWEKRKDIHNIMGPEDIQRTVEMNAQWTALSQELGIIANKFASEISPGIISTTRALIDLVKEIKNSFVGDFIKTMGRGISNAGQLLDIGYTYTKAASMDWQSDVLARSSTFRHPGTTSHGPVTVNSHQYINGDDVGAMKHAVKEAQKEAIAEAFHASPAMGY